MTPQAGPQRIWTYYPGTDRLETEQHPESSFTTRYDYIGGRLWKKTTARGVFEMGYDANDRVTSISAPGGYPNTVTFAYDESDNRTKVENGHIKSVFVYNSADLPEIRQDTIPDQLAIAQTMYHYSAWDDLSRIDYPSGLVTRYGYDNAGRPTSVVRGATETLVAEVTEYHPSGAIQKLRLGNNIVETFGYHPQRYWPTSISGGPLPLTYTYYPVGNVATITDGRSSALNQTFSYDERDRLWAIGGFGANAFNYDDYGSREWKQTGNILYLHDANRRLYEVGGPSGHPEVGIYTYHPSGSLIADPSASYWHTPFEMIETVNVGALPATTYRYNGDNLRRARINSLGQDWFFYGPGDQVLSESHRDSGADPVWVRDYIYLAGRLVASLSVPVRVDFTTSSSTVGENAGSVTITVQVVTPNGQPLEKPVSVAYSTRNGTAMATSDYTTASGTLNFGAALPSGSTQTINVPIVNDLVFEDPQDEVFTVSLSNPTNASSVNAKHTVTIKDDEPMLAGFIDLPITNSTVQNQFSIAGWVLDARSASGSGVTQVDLFARIGPGFVGPGTYLGAATLGIARPDIAAVYGPIGAASGFAFAAWGLPPGTYDIDAYAHFTNGSAVSLPPRRVTVLRNRAPFDFDLDGKSEIGTFRESNGGWNVLKSGTSFTGGDVYTFGGVGRRPGAGGLRR